MTDMEQVHRRFEDHERRISGLETTRAHVDLKFGSLESLLNEKMSHMQKSIDGWNKIGFWLLTTVGTPMIIGAVAAAAWFIANGGAPGS